MFGYLQPDLETVLKRDITLLHTYNCSVCSQFTQCGVKCCLYRNFDFGFLNILIHNILKQKSEHKENLCSLSVLKKSQIVEDDITKKVMEVATLCFHFARKYKNIADKELNKIAKKINQKCFKKSFASNESLYLDMETFLKEFHKNQQEKVTDLKKYCEPIGKMVQSFAKHFNLNKEAQQLFYFVGCWVCFVDMIGSLKVDHKNKNYNPLLTKYNYQRDTDKFLYSFGKYMKKDYFYFTKGMKKYFNRIPEITGKHLIKSVLIDAPYKFGKEFSK